MGIANFLNMEFRGFVYTREDRIRDLAAKQWEEAGKPEGRDQEFWFAAEKAIADAIHRGVGDWRVTKIDQDTKIDGVDYESTEDVTIEMSQRYIPKIDVSDSASHQE